MYMNHRLHIYIWYTEYTTVNMVLGSEYKFFNKAQLLHRLIIEVIEVKLKVSLGKIYFIYFLSREVSHDIIYIYLYVSVCVRVYAFIIHLVESSFSLDFSGSFFSLFSYSMNTVFHGPIILTIVWFHFKLVIQWSITWCLSIVTVLQRVRSHCLQFLSGSLRTQRRVVVSFQHGELILHGI